MAYSKLHFVSHALSFSFALLHLFFNTGNDSAVQIIVAQRHGELYDETTALLRHLDDPPPVFSGITENVAEAMISRTNGTHAVELEATLCYGIDSLLALLLAQSMAQRRVMDTFFFLVYYYLPLMCEFL